MSDPQERVTCPGCGKAFRWQSKLIGRQVPCKHCGAEFEVPIAPGEGVLIKPAPDPVAEDGTYELDLDEANEPAAQSSTAASSVGTLKCPQCNAPVREGAVLCMNCGFNLKEGRMTETAVAAVAAEPEEAAGNLTKRQQREMEQAAEAHAAHWMLDYKGPIILIIIGLALVLINNVILAPMAPVFTDFYSSRVDIIIDLSIATAYGAVVGSVLLFAGLFILVWLFGSGFGELGSVLLKVFAIALLTQESDFLVVVLLDIAMGTGGLGIYVSWAVYLTVMITLCMKYLDVDFTEFRVLFWFIIIGRIATDMSLGLFIEQLI
ncbi:MAG: zinc-ribbon domain-containing protein [Planctomycetota bacterium]